MRIQIQFPTLGRPVKFLDCFAKYINLASLKHQLFFNINCDLADQSMNNGNVVVDIQNIMLARQRPDVLKGKLYFDSNTEKISAINDHIDPNTFDVIVVASDDMVPQVEGWDDEIARAMEANFPNLDGCVYFDDGYQHKKLITFSILGRELYNQFGYIYHPDYKSLYCDNEFTIEVQRMNKVAFVDKCIIKHEHYSEAGNSNSGDFDTCAEKTLQFSGRDGAVFKERQRLGFPKERITND